MQLQSDQEELKLATADTADPKQAGLQSDQEELK